MNPPIPIPPTPSARLVGCLILAAIGIALSAPQATAQEDKLIEDPDIIVEIDGLACPFCAYGIEKRLRKVEGLAELSVLLEEGKVQLKLEQGATVSEERLREAVAEAGFEARRIVFVDERTEAQSSP